MASSRRNRIDQPAILDLREDAPTLCSDTSTGLSATLRVVVTGTGERWFVVVVTIGSTTTYLDLDTARRTVDELPRRLRKVIDLADECAHRQSSVPVDAVDGVRLVAADEPAGDGDDGVISGCQM